MVGWEKRNGSASLAVKWRFEHNGADLSAEIPSQMALWGGDFMKNENSAVWIVYRETVMSSGFFWRMFDQLLLRDFGDASNGEIKMIYCGCLPGWLAFKAIQNAQLSFRACFCSRQPCTAA